MHEHSDRGGGYCDCGAERCSLRECDAHCVHPDGWIEATELARLRDPMAAYRLAYGLPMTCE